MARSASAAPARVDDQCVANAARHLTDDGVFVVETVVSDAVYGLRQRDGVDWTY